MLPNISGMPKWLQNMRNAFYNKENLYFIALVSFGLVVTVLGTLSFFGMTNWGLFGTSNNVGLLLQQQQNQHLHHTAFAQPAADYPIPDAKRMFTPDKAIIREYRLDPYILDMAQLPKSPEAGKPALFVFNLFDTASRTWLWHTDMRIQITDPKGQPILVFPNNHGHGGVIQFEYVFPSAGIYNIDLILGQQTGSPNFMIEPKVIREENFDVVVQKAQPGSQLSSSTPGLTSNVAAAAHIKDIPIKAESWKFTPNVINVNKGDLVRLHFVTAQDEVELYNGHGFGIEGYDVNVFLTKGTQQLVEFLADKPGTFTFRCTSFCSSPGAAVENHFNMVGKLIVHA
jgi:plastocyanin